MIYGALNHYVYPQLDVECQCKLCVVWRSERDAFDKFKRLTFDHDRSCMCWRCVRRRQLQQAFLAAAAKRELYCEFSWHASRHPSYGNTLMNWVSQELDANRETNGWWATLAQAYSLSFWLARFQSSLDPKSAAEEDEAPASLWCGWCGDDIPSGEFCSDTCRADHQASIAAERPRGPRLRLSDSALCVIASGMPPRTSGWAVSGIAA